MHFLSTDIARLKITLAVITTLSQSYVSAKAICRLGSPPGIWSQGRNELVSYIRQNKQESMEQTP